MCEKETYSVSVSLSQNGRDYELEALIEAFSPKYAALIFVRDWIQEISLLKKNETIISVSEPRGAIYLFVLRDNLCLELGKEID